MDFDVEEERYALDKAAFDESKAFSRHMEKWGNRQVEKEYEAIQKRRQGLEDIREHRDLGIRRIDLDIKALKR
jgi:hypothetical protein